MQHPIPLDVRALRLRLGYTQARLAQALGVSVVSVSRWENRHAHPQKHLDTALRRLAQRKRGSK